MNLNLLILDITIQGNVDNNHRGVNGKMGKEGRGGEGEWGGDCPN